MVSPGGNSELSDPLLLSFLLAWPALLVLICLESGRRNRDDKLHTESRSRTNITDLWVGVARGSHGAGRRGMSP